MERFHRLTEEICHFAAGSGRMRLGESANAPAYTHEDTALLG